MQARFSDFRATKSCFLSKEREVETAWSLGLFQSVRCGLRKGPVSSLHPLPYEGEAAPAADT